jgi:hypothetical protein
MDVNNKSLYIESFKDIKRISNFEEIKTGELIILFPFNLNEKSFIDKNDMVHYDIVILPLEIFLNNGFKTLIVNRSPHFITFLASEAEYNSHKPLDKHIITINHSNQDKYLILKANCHDLIEIIDLSLPNTKHYTWKILSILYYFIIIMSLFLYIIKINY